MVFYSRDLRKRQARKLSEDKDDQVAGKLGVNFNHLILIPEL